MQENKAEILELEKTILGEIIIADKNLQLDSLAELKSSDFIVDKYRLVYEVMNRIAAEGKRIDTTLLYEAVKELKFISVGELAGLSTNAATDVNLLTHIKQLKFNRYKERLRKEVGEGLKELKNAYFFEDIEAVKEKLIAMMSGLNYDDVSMFEDLPKTQKEFIESLDKEKEIDGYSWGISSLDFETGGITKPFMTLIGGLKKGGKTRFLIHLIRKLMEQNVKVGFLSMEATGLEFVKLISANISEVSDYYIRRPTLLNDTPEMKDKLKAVKLNFDKIYLEHASGLTFDQICGRIRRYAKLGVEVMAIDHLQRIRLTGKGKSKVEEMEDGTQRIADETRKNNIHVILLSQFNTEAEKDKPSIANLKWGGGGAEAADLIMLIDNKFRRTKKEDDKGEITFMLEQRNGEYAEVNVEADLGICRFEDSADARARREANRMNGNPI